MTGVVTITSRLLDSFKMLRSTMGLEFGRYIEFHADYPAMTLHAKASAIYQYMPLQYQKLAGYALFFSTSASEQMRLSANHKGLAGELSRVRCALLHLG